MGDDFGFTFEPAADMVRIQQASQLADQNDQLKAKTAEIEQLQDRLRKMFAKSAALATQLQREPDKPAIKWPNRIDQLTKFIEELKTLRDGK